MDWSSVLAGFFAGLSLGGGLVGWRYLRAIESVRDVHPVERAGSVTAPPVPLEDRLERLGISADAIERGARELMDAAKSRGISLAYEDALASAEAMLREGSMYLETDTG